MRHIHWSAAPENATPTQKSNFLKVQIDGVGIGVASAASTFLPVFLTRLGASNFEVGLLTSMPAFTGLFLAIIVGRFLQGRRQVVPWYSRARFIVVMCYALTGLIPFVVPRSFIVPAVLAVWAVATLPQIVVNVAFSVVMNAVAGPEGRYDLMSRRWSILGLTNALAVAGAGFMLDHLGFPVNYQLVFMGLSLGGFLSYTFSSRIDLPDATPPAQTTGQSAGQRLRGYFSLIRSHPAFVSFTAKRFIYLSGTALATPIFPLYFVRQVNASDSAIGLINTIQTAVMLVGYSLWARQSKVHGSRFVLMCTTLAMSIYPALVATTQRVELIMLYAGLAGIFQAGIDLVFFDELMKTVPADYSATFVSLAQSLQYISTVAAPLVGTLLADHIGLGGALLVSAALRLIAFVWFARREQAPAAHPQPEGQPQPAAK